MREKTLLHLQRRFEEVINVTVLGLTSPQRYYQFLSNLAHYMQYIDEKRLTKSAIKKLHRNKKQKKLDKELIREADRMIARMKADRDKLVNSARRRSIPIAMPDTQGVARQLDDAESFGIHITGLNQFLDGRDQYVGDLPRYIGELRQSAWYLARTMTRPPRWLEDLKTSYNTDQDAYARKLESFKILSDYLRLDDYRELEKIRRYIYGLADQNEALIFLLKNDDLIDRSNKRGYQAHDIQNAKNNADDYVGHLQRLHNYLSDELENPSWYEKLWAWFREHLLPTFISFLIVLLVYVVLNKLLHIHIGLKELNDFLK